MRLYITQILQTGKLSSGSTHKKKLVSFPTRAVFLITPITHWLVSFKGHLLILSANPDQHNSTEVTVDLQLNSSNSGKMSLRFWAWQNVFSLTLSGTKIVCHCAKELESAKTRAKACDNEAGKAGSRACERALDRPRSRRVRVAEG